MLTKLLLVGALSGVGGCSSLGELVSVFFAPEDRDQMLQVAYCESSADADDTYSTAINPKSRAAGWFQHLPQYWDDRSTAAGYPDTHVLDPVANVAVASHLYYGQNSNERWGGLSHWWPSYRCWETQ